MFAFRPQSRLLQASDYKYVFNQAQYKVHQPSFLFLANPTQSAHQQNRLGIVVQKKKIKRAHERNRLKRLIRENFRLNQQLINPKLDIVVMPKKGADLVLNADIEQQLLTALTKLARLAANKKNNTVLSGPSG